MEQLDALILEDEKQEMIREQIPAGITFKIVGTSSEFQGYFKDGNRAKLYFLDNHVPRRDGEGPRAELEFNYRQLKRFVPDAKVFYIGADPEKQVIDFCSANKIPVIGKHEVGTYIKKELSK